MPIDFRSPYPTRYWESAGEISVLTKAARNCAFDAGTQKTIMQSWKRRGRKEIASD